MAASAELHVLILAAGASKRLGRAKQLIDYQGQTLLERTCRLALTQSNHVHVSIAVNAASEIREILRQLPVEELENNDSTKGMSSSISLGIKALPSSAAGLMIMLCDQYRLEQDDLEKLTHAWRMSPDQIVASQYGETLGVPTIWPSIFFSELAQLEGDKGARYLLKIHRQKVTAIELPNANTDLDTPDQHQQLIQNSKD